MIGQLDMRLREYMDKQVDETRSCTLHGSSGLR